MQRKYALLTRLFLFLLFIGGGTSISQGESFYTVKQGDSLYTIAKKFKIKVGELKESNQLEDSKIKPGQRLIIPELLGNEQTSGTEKKREKISGRKKNPESWDIPATHTVKKGETLRQIARRYGLTVLDLKEANELSGEKIKTGQVLYLPQVYRGDIVGGEDKEDGEKRVNGLGFLITERDRELLVRVAKSFWGLRYTRGGTSINGMDCSAFVQRVFKVFGIELPRTTREQYQVGYAVPRHSLRRGDLLIGA